MPLSFLRDFLRCRFPSVTEASNFRFLIGMRLSYIVRFTFRVSVRVRLRVRVRARVRIRVRIMFVSLNYENCTEAMFHFSHPPLSTTNTCPFPVFGPSLSIRGRFNPRPGVAQGRVPAPTLP